VTASLDPLLRSLIQQPMPTSVILRRDRIRSSTDNLLRRDTSDAAELLLEAAEALDEVVTHPSILWVT
jgi:hypothetical protein